MSTNPSAAEVWAIVAKHSACCCDNCALDDRPCLVHHRAAAEVWIIAQGLMLTKAGERAWHRPGDLRNNGPKKCWQCLVICSRQPLWEVARNVRTMYGLPTCAVRFYAGEWYGVGSVGYSRLEDLLICMGNYH